MKTCPPLAFALPLFCLVSPWFLLVGCKPSLPSTTGQDQARREEPAAPASPNAKRKPDADDLARFFRSKIPAGPVKLADLKADPPMPLPGAAAGSNAWAYNVRVVFAPNEDLLRRPLQTSKPLWTN